MRDPKMLAQAVALSILFLLILFLVVSIDLFDRLELIHVLVALVPFGVWLVISGRLERVSGGPEGLSFALRAEAQRPVSPDATEAEVEVDPAIVMEKGVSLESVRDSLAEQQPTVLSFGVGEHRFYSRDAIDLYLEALERSPRFRHVLFVDDQGRFLGLMPVGEFRGLLHTGEAVEGMENGSILDDPRTIRDSIELGSSNQHTLNEMDRLNLDTLAVVDRRDRFVGVITQGEIVRKILTKLIREV